MSSSYQLDYHVENKQSCVSVSWFCTGVWSQGPRGNWVVPGSSAAPHVRGACKPVQAEITIDMDEDATHLLSDMDDKGLFHAFGSWQRFHEASGASALIHICLGIKYLQHWLVPMHGKVWAGAHFVLYFQSPKHIWNLIVYHTHGVLQDMDSVLWQIPDSYQKQPGFWLTGSMDCGTSVQILPNSWISLHLLIPVKYTTLVVCYEYLAIPHICEGYS